MRDSLGRLDGKVAIVTGGGSGIGEAVCQELARRGAQVIVADVNADDAERVAETIVRDGGKAEPRRVDVSDASDIGQLVEETASERGRLDYQFNNAAIVIGGDARDLAPGQWQRVLDTNLHGVLHGTLAAYPVMVRQGFGHIVNTSSAAGLLPEPFNAPYTTAKYGVVGLSLSLRLEGAGLGVNVSVVCPGYVRTNMHQNAVMINVSRDEAPSTPFGALEPAQAAHRILDGVARNTALITFPGYVRWVWRFSCLFPRLFERAYLPRVRKAQQRRISQ